MELGVSLGKISGILIVVGAICLGYAMFTGCKYPSVCEDGRFLIPFGGIFFAGVLLLFLGVKLNKKESVKKES